MPSQYEKRKSKLNPYKLFWGLGILYAVFFIFFYLFYSTTHFQLRRSEVFQEFWYLFIPVIIWLYLINRFKNGK